MLLELTSLSRYILKLNGVEICGNLMPERSVSLLSENQVTLGTLLYIGAYTHKQYINYYYYYFFFIFKRMLEDLCKSYAKLIMSHALM